jgi:hypothetical protein
MISLSRIAGLKIAREWPSIRRKSRQLHTKRAGKVAPRHYH